MLEEYFVTLTTTGGAGASGGNVTVPFPMNGYLVGLYLTSSVAVAATTDFTFTDSVSGIALLTLANSTVTGWIAPALKPVDVAGAAITNSHRGIPVVNPIKLTVAEGDDGTVTVRYYIEKL